MPPGQSALFTVMLPDESRVPCHQPSSILTYWYPAASMPEEASASVCASITLAFIFAANEFQDAHPIGGVEMEAVAGAPGAAATAPAPPTTVSATTASAQIRAPIRLRAMLGITGQTCPVIYLFPRLRPPRSAYSAATSKLAEMDVLPRSHALGPPTRCKAIPDVDHTRRSGDRLAAPRWWNRSSHGVNRLNKRVRKSPLSCRTAVE